MILEGGDIDFNRLSQAKFSYIQSVFSSPIDEVAIAESVLKIYSEASPKDKPRILIARGPLEAKRFLEVALGVVSDAKGAADLPIEFGEFQNAKNLSDAFHYRSMEAAQSCSKSFVASTQKDKGKELRNMIFSDLNFQLSRAVYGRIRELNLLKFSRDEFRLRPCNSPSWDDLDWVGFYRLGQDQFGESIISDKLTEQFLQNGGMQLYAFNDFAIICLKPIRVVRNENLILHSEEGPALIWDDGTKAYFWDGIEIPENLIENPLDISAEDILQETNAEIRRCYQEILGSERFASLLGLTALDQKQDRFGNDLVLYRTVEVDRLAGDYIYFAKVVCPSTGRNYFLCVPPKIRNVEEAVAWTFGKSAEEYKPSIET